MYLLTSEEEFEKLYGKRSNKARKLYNGMIKCYLYQYFKDMGDKKPFAKNKKTFNDKNRGERK